MPAPVRRAASAPAPAKGISFLKPTFYVGGGDFTLPEGDYALDFQVVNHAFKVGSIPRLMVLLTAYPLSGGEPLPQYLSMGDKASKSFQPNPDTGKGLVAIPGGPMASLSKKSNWGVFYESLLQCGLPEEAVDDDFAAIDGIWVHIQRIPEPEDRKNMGPKTGDVQEEPRGPGFLPVVTEILEGGKPWEGTGGFDFAEAPAPAPVVPLASRRAAAPAAKAAPARPAARVAAPAPIEEEAVDDTLEVQVQGVLQTILEKSPNGMTKAVMKLNAHKALVTQFGDETAQAAQKVIFSSDAALGQVLGSLGYGVKGTMVSPL